MRSRLSRIEPQNQCGGDRGTPPAPRQRRLISIALIAGLIVSLTGAVAVSAAPPRTGAKGPKAPFRLLPSVKSVAPGASFEVAIAYELADGWHIYWKNPGMVGQPPKITWQLPPGFKADPLRFPMPSRYVSGPDDFRMVNYIHEGKPVLLATLAAPADLKPGDTLTIAAKVDSLVCEKACVPETRTESFKLPVVASAAAMQPNEEELFARAARRIPPAHGKGKYITATAKASTDSVKIGDTFEVAVTVDIRKGFHIQSHRPFLAGLIPTEAIPEPVDGLYFEDPTYPDPVEKIDKRLGQKLSEFHGQAVVRIPVEVNDEAVGTSLDLAGIVIAQACAEQSGRCFPPEAVAWSTSVALVGAPAVEAAADDASTDDATLAATAGPSDGTSTDIGAPAIEDQPDATSATESAGEDTVADTTGAPMSLLGILIGALFGGMLLNVMPCVWPVLSIKVLSFVQQAHDDPQRTLRLGMLFAFGILVSFWLLGLVAVAAKAADQHATWGTHFANPTFVVVMIAILYVFGLSLFGVFEFNLPGAASSTLSAAAMKEGYGGSFVKGMLATVLATPCTAPLLGPAIAVAFSQSGTVIMLAMTAIGVGMGLPYVVLAAKPALLRFLPKPGPWMDTFKQLTGFLLLGVVIWLLWILGDLLGASGVVSTAAFLTFLGLACWVYGKIGFTWSGTARAVATVGVLAIATGGGWFAFGYMYTPPEEPVYLTADDAGLPRVPGPSDWNGKMPWVKHRPGLQRELADAGYTVFLNYTATWCTECQIEKKAVLETDAVRKKMRELMVVPLKADFTRRPDWIADELQGYGRAGVPLNVILPAGRPDQPIILPQILTKGAVREALTKAGASIAAPTGLARKP